MPLAVAALQLPSTASLAQQVLSTMLLQQPLLAESLARYQTVGITWLLPFPRQLVALLWSDRQHSGLSILASSWLVESGLLLSISRLGCGTTRAPLIVAVRCGWLLS